ncbi:MAG: hypothetical protein C0609_05925 [Deltaproteobacteria bacterium]|nr:MAG: hypothetical protein C0609_05925 [Deltaproteobacteria bacterium]
MRLNKLTIALFFAISIIGYSHGAERAPADGGNIYEDFNTLEELERIYQPYASNASTHEPMYFLVGTDPKKSKFQISFKYRLFNPEGSMWESHKWLQGLYFGYTQTSYWDLKSTSAPFEETSYKPELFILTNNFNVLPDFGAKLFLQTGVKHESNGQAGEESRSTNYFYFRPIYVKPYFKRGGGIYIAPKLQLFFINDDTNKDIDEYRGNFELDISAGYLYGLVASAKIALAEKGVSGFVDFTYPLSSLLDDNLDLYFHVQYVNALAEGLRDYRGREEALRIGLSFVR